MRRASREYVFKLVFEFTFYGSANEETLDLFLTDADLNDEDKEYIRERSDMVVLLIALYELERGDTPAKIVVNEAVDLAKKYGTEKSGGFVNGVLAKFVREDAKGA